MLSLILCSFVLWVIIYILYKFLIYVFYFYDSNRCLLSIWCLKWFSSQCWPVAYFSISHSFIFHHQIICRFKNVYLKICHQVKSFYQTSSFMFGNVCLLPSYLPTNSTFRSGFFYELWRLFHCLLALIMLSFFSILFIYFFWERECKLGKGGGAGRESQALSMTWTQTKSQPLDWTQAPQHQ